MANIYNAEPTELIEKAAEELKNLEEIKPAEWACFVKTGMHKERPPVREDWWYVRAASILKKIQRFGPIGVSKLRKKYGGKKNRGVKPGRFYKASGNIIRKIMQQLTKAELIKDAKKGVHKGKVITPKGISLLSKAAEGLAVIVKKEDKKKDIKKTEDKKEAVKAVKEKTAEKKAKEETRSEEKSKEKTKSKSKEDIKEKSREKKSEDKVKKTGLEEKIPSAHELAAKKNG